MFVVSLRSALLGLQWREQRTMGGRMRCGGNRPCVAIFPSDSLCSSSFVIHEGEEAAPCCITVGCFLGRCIWVVAGNPDGMMPLAVTLISEI